MTHYTIHGWSYHRNGVAGEGFYTVDFTLEEDGDCVGLIAVMPESLRDHDWCEGGTPCFVINPDNPLDSKWRGDSIGHALVKQGLWEMVDDDSERRWQNFLNGNTTDV